MIFLKHNTEFLFTKTTLPFTFLLSVPFAFSLSVSPTFSICEISSVLPVDISLPTCEFSSVLPVDISLSIYEFSSALPLVLGHGCTAPWVQSTCDTHAHLMSLPFMSLNSSSSRTKVGMSDEVSWLWIYWGWLV